MVQDSIPSQLSMAKNRGVFRTKSNIYVGAFCQNSQRLSAVKYFWLGSKCTSGNTWTQLISQ